MKRWSVGLRLAGIVLALALPSIAAAQGGQLGYIEVHGQGVDGASVYVSGQLKGKVANGQLLVKNIYPGTYQVRVELKPYYPQAFQVTVKAGQGVAVNVGVGKIAVQDEIQKAVKATATLAPSKSAVRLTCIPMTCALEIKAGQDGSAASRFQPQTFSKGFGDDAILVTGLPQGDYVFTVTSPGTNQTLTASHGICDGEQVSIQADFTSSTGGLTFGPSNYPACKALPVQTASQP